MVMVWMQGMTEEADRVVVARKFFAVEDVEIGRRDAGKYRREEGSE